MKFFLGGVGIKSDNSYAHHMNFFESHDRNNMFVDNIPTKQISFEQSSLSEVFLVAHSLMCICSCQSHFHR